MSLLLFKLFAAFSILIITLISGWKPLHKHIISKTHSSFILGSAFADGVFLGAALFHMLPDSASEFHQLFGNDSYPYANLLCALGFIILMFVENFSLSLVKKESNISKNLIPLVLTAALSIHAFITGTALGINTTIAATLIIFIAIIAHKSSESFALAVNLTKKGNLSTKNILLIYFIFSLVTPLGILLGTLIVNTLASYSGQLLEAIFNAIAAGTFLYIATIHSVQKEMHLQNNLMLSFVMMLCGLVLMAMVAVWV